MVKLLFEPSIFIRFYNFIPSHISTIKIDNNFPFKRMMPPHWPVPLLISFFVLIFVPSSTLGDANSKLKKCCTKLVDDDKDCVSRFCDFDAISQTNVIPFIGIYVPQIYVSHKFPQVLNYLSTCTERGETVSFCHQEKTMKIRGF